MPPHSVINTHWPYNIYKICNMLQSLQSVLTMMLLPGTAGGTVRRKAVRVAIATSSGLYLMLQLCPGVTMFGLSNVPSKYTRCSDMAL